MLIINFTQKSQNAVLQVYNKCYDHVNPITLARTMCD